MWRNGRRDGLRNHCLWRAGSSPATCTIYQGVAQFDRALLLGSRGRRFESSYPDHLLPNISIPVNKIGIRLVERNHSFISNFCFCWSYAFCMVFSWCRGGENIMSENNVKESILKRINSAREMIKELSDKDLQNNKAGATLHSIKKVRDDLDIYYRLIESGLGAVTKTIDCVSSVPKYKSLVKNFLSNVMQDSLSRASECLNVAEAMVNEKEVADSYSKFSEALKDHKQNEVLKNARSVNEQSYHVENDPEGNLSVSLLKAISRGELIGKEFKARVLLCSKDSRGYTTGILIPMDIKHHKNTVSFISEIDLEGRDIVAYKYRIELIGLPINEITGCEHTAEITRFIKRDD